jgi:probable phosphoglycerate mutase
MTRLLLVRHGATQRTAEDRFSGAVGVDLSDDGRRQVARLAARLADDPVRAVYASPLSRTVETARILAAPHQLPVVERDGLREISHGHWEGRTRREVEEGFPRSTPPGRRIRSPSRPKAASRGWRCWRARCR